jgi:hypothetical protein
MTSDGFYRLRTRDEVLKQLYRPEVNLQYVRKSYYKLILYTYNILCLKKIGILNNA